MLISKKFCRVFVVLIKIGCGLALRRNRLQCLSHECRFHTNTLEPKLNASMAKQAAGPHVIFQKDMILCYTAAETSELVSAELCL